MHRSKTLTISSIDIFRWGDHTTFLHATARYARLEILEFRKPIPWLQRCQGYRSEVRSVWRHCSDYPGAAPCVLTNTA